MKGRTEINKTDKSSFKHVILNYFVQFVLNCFVLGSKHTHTCTHTHTHTHTYVHRCIVAVQSLSHFWLFSAPWTAAHEASLSFTISQGLLKVMSIELMMPSNYLILCCLLLMLPSIFPSIRVFSNELALHIRWPTYWSSSISPSNEYSGLILFRIDWFYLLAIKGLLRVFSSTTIWKNQFYGA